MSKENKKDKRENGPVPVGYDYRGKEHKKKTTDTVAPDGISGDWG